LRAADTEASDDRAKPRAFKNLPFGLRNFCIFYNPTMDAMANSEHAEFYFYHPGIM
jgi:hypothetical protein